MSGIFLLVDGCHGIYVPRSFAQRYGDHVKGVDPADIELLLKGPDEVEHYWDVWAEVLDQGYIERDGYKYLLDQEGDLFAVCRERMTPSEHENYYGEPMGAEE